MGIIVPMFWFQLKKNKHFLYVFNVSKKKWYLLFYFLVRKYIAIIGIFRLFTTLTYTRTHAHTCTNTHSYSEN